MTQYVCPDCKSTLQDWICSSCKQDYNTDGKDGIPVLLSKDPRFSSAATIGAVYDDIYSNRSSVWEDQGRTPEFIRYFSELASSHSPSSLLEIGCGEGVLLSALSSPSKNAVDISAKALSLAKKRTGANCAVACAERLPFSDDQFDMVVSVGVMEHFIDDNAACREITRVLKSDGIYLALIHVSLTRIQELRQKIREYVWPRPRPLALSRWLISKLHKPIHQPIQRKYSVQSGRLRIEHGGLVVKNVITKSDNGEVPLIGPHVVIYVCTKASR